jgi:predicted Zn-dependent peptidase
VDQLAEKRLYGEAEANPQVEVHWHSVPFAHRDSYALNILAQLLSTRTGRFYKGLVLGSQVATEVQAAAQHRKWAGTFGVSGEAREGHTPEEVEQAIYAEIEKLKQTEVPSQELQKVKNNFAANEFRRLTGNMSILMQLLYSDGMGDWREINEAGRKHQAVTAADIQRVVNKYFKKENRNVAIYTRKPGESSSETTPPELAGLSAEQQAGIKAMLKRVSQEKDAEKLKMALQKMDGVAEPSDEKLKAIYQLQKKAIQQRLEELK